MVKHIAKSLCVAASVSLFATASLAADASPLSPPPSPPTDTPLDQGWRYQVTLYAWASAIDGDIGIRGLPPVNVDLSAWDAIQDLDGALSGSILATNGTWLFLTDLLWGKLSSDATIGPASGTLEFEQEQLLASAVVGHSLPINIPGLELAMTAGLRYQRYEAQVDISPALVPLTISREGSKDWVDPIVGLALHHDIDDRWFINATADIGGFGVSSDFTANGFATVGYNWTEKISTAIGYRALYTDYNDDGFVYDVTQHGVYTSIGFHF